MAAWRLLSLPVWSRDVRSTFGVFNVMYTKITNRLLKAGRPPFDGELFIRDTDLNGFGVRVTTNRSVSSFAEGPHKQGPSKRVGLARWSG